MIREPHQFLTDADGKRTHVVLSVEDYEEMIDQLLDIEDVEEIRRRKAEGGERVLLEDLKKQLAL